MDDNRGRHILQAKQGRDATETESKAKMSRLRTRSVVADFGGEVVTDVALVELI